MIVMPPLMTSAQQLADEIFIHHIIQNRIIWDKSLEDFKNVKRKEEAWNNLSKTLKISNTWAIRRYKTLREKYRREKLKLNENNCNKPWKYYQLMSFLDSVQKPRKRKLLKNDNNELNNDLYGDCCTTNDDIQNYFPIGESCSLLLREREEINERLLNIKEEVIQQEDNNNYSLNTCSSGNLTTKTSTAVPSKTTLIEVVHEEDPPPLLGHHDIDAETLYPLDTNDDIDNIDDDDDDDDDIHFNIDNISSAASIINNQNSPNKQTTLKNKSTKQTTTQIDILTKKLKYNQLIATSLNNISEILCQQNNSNNDPLMTFCKYIECELRSFNDEKKRNDIMGEIIKIIYKNKDS